MIEHLIPEPANQTKKYPKKSARQKEFQNRLVRMYSKHLKPLSFVEEEEFRGLIEFADPKLSFPTRKTFRNVILPKTFDHEEQLLRQEIQNAKHISFTTDLWSSKFKFSFILLSDGTN